MTKKRRKSIPKKADKIPVKKQKRIRKEYLSERTIKILSLVSLVVFAVIIILIRSNFLEIPFERDEGEYVLFGDLILKGKVPYIDFYEQKPAGLFYSYAFMVAIFGTTLKGLHIGFIVLNLITIYLIYQIAKNFFGELSGAVGGISFGLLSMTQYASGFTIQSEHIIILFVVASTYLMQVAKRKDNTWILFASGIFGGFSLMVKQNGLFFCLAIGILLLMYYFPKNWKIEWRRVIRKSLIFGAGILSPVVISILILIIQGAFDEFLFWVIQYPADYVSTITLELGKSLFLGVWPLITDPYLFFWILGGLGLLLVLFSDLDRPIKIFILIFAIFSAIAIIPGLRFTGHYFILLFPALALSIAAFLYTTIYFTKKYSKSNWLGLMLFVSFLFMAGLNVYQLRDYYFDPNHTIILKQTYGNNPFPEAKTLSDYIKSKANPGDKIAVMGSEPQMYVYTGLESATSHYFMGFLMRPYEKCAEWQAQARTEIEATKPRFMVMVFHSYSWIMLDGSDTTLFRWSNSYMKNNYDQIAYADIVRGHANYIYGEGAKNHSPGSDSYIMVYERR
jgi:4-amino-4-deoxy-L-arabinose transferase-like glycosyltransferase